MKQQLKIDVKWMKMEKLNQKLIIEASVPLIASVILTVVNNLKSQSEEAAKQLMKAVFSTYMAENLEDLMKG